jgi:hypothetical protein
MFWRHAYESEEIFNVVMLPVLQNYAVFVVSCSIIRDWEPLFSYYAFRQLYFTIVGPHK